MNSKYVDRVKKPEALPWGLGAAAALMGVNTVLLWGLGIVVAGLVVSLWLEKAWWLIHVSGPVLKICFYIAFPADLFGIFLLFVKGGRYIAVSSFHIAREICLYELYAVTIVFLFQQTTAHWLFVIFTLLPGINTTLLFISDLFTRQWAVVFTIILYVIGWGVASGLLGVAQALAERDVAHQDKHPALESGDTV